MDFSQDLEQVLPADLPNRARVISVTARHLALIAEANTHMNLTRITEPREAVIKHVLDSVLPWSLFVNATTVMDAGTGAGFPGIPLAAALPDTNFVLVDSTQKKARFVESAVAALDLPNAEVAAERAEDVLRHSRFHIVTARAVAPIERALTYFADGLKAGATALLYKGPDAQAEIDEAQWEAKRHHASADVVMRYSLPDGLGSRAIVRLSRGSVASSISGR